MTDLNDLEASEQRMTGGIIQQAIDEIDMILYQYATSVISLKSAKTQIALKKQELIEKINALRGSCIEFANPGGDVSYDDCDSIIDKLIGKE